MEIIEQNDLSIEQKGRIVELWNAEYPLSIRLDGVAGLDDYLNERAEKRHFLLADAAGEIVGWALIFEREGAKWFAIIVDGKMQGKGLGVKLVERLKAAENQLFGWVIDNDESRKANGEKYKSPLGFYAKTGFKIHETERIERLGISGVKIEWNLSGI